MFDFNDVQPLRAERPVRHDLDLIVRRLRDTAESWVPRLFPNGRRVGDEWRLANIRGDAPRKEWLLRHQPEGPACRRLARVRRRSGRRADQRHQPSDGPRWRGTYRGGS